MQRDPVLRENGKAGVEMFEFRGVPVRIRRVKGVLWIAGIDVAAAIGAEPRFDWGLRGISHNAVRMMPALYGSASLIAYCTIPAVILFCQGVGSKAAARRLDFLEWLARLIPSLKGKVSVPCVMTGEARALEFDGVCVHVRLVGDEWWVQARSLLAAFGFRNDKGFQWRDYGIQPEDVCYMSLADGVVNRYSFLSLRGVVRFCSRGRKKKRELGSEFLAALSRVVSMPLALEPVRPMKRRSRFRRISDVRWSRLMSALIAFRQRVPIAALGNAPVPIPSLEGRSRLDEKLDWLNSFVPKGVSKKFTRTSWDNARRPERLGQMLPEDEWVEIYMDMLRQENASHSMGVHAFA